MRNRLPIFLAMRPRLNSLIRNLPARLLTQSMGAAVTPWHTAYPSPRDTRPESLTQKQVLAKLRGGNELQGTNFLLVDLRSNDHEGGTIRGSINLPAQSLYPAIPTLYTVCKAAGIHTIIWYCGSSQGRGPRAAGWFRDYLASQGDKETRSVILRGGIKGWATAGREYTEWIDEYDASKWSN
jgi:arsenical-resistance protein 2